MSEIPVITIDGPSGTGKGTLTHKLAEQLKWHLLDSGAIYRVLAYWLIQKNCEAPDVESVIHYANDLPVSFKSCPGAKSSVYLQDDDVTQLIRTVDCSRMASKISSIPEVRMALLARQRVFKKLPGLVTDGRDMGTVVFPEAQLKLYLEADAGVRAKRRHKQLIDNGIDVSLAHVLAELQARDERDMKRSAAPLRPAADAEIIDTSHLSIQDVLARVLQLVGERFIVA